MRLPAGLPATAPLISENVLRRQLGLLEPPPEVERSLGRDEIERLSGLTPNLLSCLVLFDVLEPVDERFAYRDLVAAREAARLLKRGVALGDVLDASISLRRRGGHLAEARLTEGPSGALVREIAGQLAELSGQLTMPLPLRPEQKARSLDDLLVEAEEAEAAAITPRPRASTRRRCAPTPPTRCCRSISATSSRRRAAPPRPRWRGRSRWRAIRPLPRPGTTWPRRRRTSSRPISPSPQYRRAVQAEPDYADAHFNLALLLTRLERCGEALAAWERFLELEPSSPQAGTAHKAIALCRMKIQQERAQAG